MEDVPTLLLNAEGPHVSLGFHAVPREDALFEYFFHISPVIEPGRRAGAVRRERSRECLEPNIA